MKLTIPYYLHKAGAGFPSPATDYIEEDIDLNVHLIKNVPATFVIRVQGKSMVSVGINEDEVFEYLIIGVVIPVVLGMLIIWISNGFIKKENDTETE